MEYTIIVWNEIVYRLEMPLVFPYWNFHTAKPTMPVMRIMIFKLILPLVD